MMQVDLMVAGGTVVTQNALREIVTPGTVAVKGDRVVAVGLTDDLQGRYVASRTLDATGHLVFPGLVNTHTHLLQTMLKGLGEGLTLYEWVRAVTGPCVPVMTARDAYLAAMLGGLEALHCGTTTLFDFQYPLPDKDLYRAVARAFRNLGLRGILGMGLTETGARFGLPAYLFQPVEEALDEWAGLTAELDTGLLSFALSPAIVFGVTSGGLQKLRAFADQHKMLLSLHINETTDDDRCTLARYGKRAVPFLESTGLLGPDLLAIHCVRMQPEDIKILARHDVKVSHNPVSNMYLGSGVAPIMEMRRAGLTIGLATDGAASNNSQDMLETMKCTGLVHKMAHRDPSILTAAEVLDMATISGARCLGQEERLGSLEPGKQADLFIVDPHHARSVPVFDPVASLVFSSGQESVVTTVVAGQVLLDEGQVTTVDEEALLAECQSAAIALARRAGTFPKSIGHPPSPGEHAT